MLRDWSGGLAVREGAKGRCRDEVAREIIPQAVKANPER